MSCPIGAIEGVTGQCPVCGWHHTGLVDEDHRPPPTDWLAWGAEGYRLQAFEAGRLAAIRAEVQWHVDRPHLYPEHVTGQRVELELRDLHRWLEATR